MQRKAEGRGPYRTYSRGVDNGGGTSQRQPGERCRAGRRDPVNPPGHSTGIGGMEIRRARTVAELVAAEGLFDGPVREEWAQRFPDAPGHLMLLAHVDGVPAGMVSGIEMSHPDKGTEMCLYELSVDEGYRRRGIGRQLAPALAEEARARGVSRHVGGGRHRQRSGAGHVRLRRRAGRGRLRHARLGAG
ncbi:hypothetical protein GCM10010347_07640 [Streptomyces cirratus]|uniref:N-acetyltransferase domain-containing protein n=1 Tax=Streptomyces cirratus TaxID=68187 RepID=A0ABQ3EJY6_9ACTN|nr:hypothetical protein GCM10010347_07640 [Streptomyces cirratus]